MSTHSLRSFLLSGVFSLVCATALLQGQQVQGQPTANVRIKQAVDNSVRVTLKGNTHPLARAEFDRGEAPADLPMKRMLLVLKRSPEQESVLLTLLDSQQDKHSPNYHKWLQPVEFGAKFGPSDSDVAAVTNWLKSSGFQVAGPSAGRTVIEFSGTASQVQSAFHTAIHKFAVNGKEHWANANDPEIPAALEKVVAGVHTLHNFFPQPQISRMKKLAGTFSKDPVPHVTLNNGAHAMGPLDFAKIYNLTPAYSAGITGSLRTIAIVARSEFNTNDLNTFYGMFGISRKFPQIIFNGDTPGNRGGGEEGEAILDVSWSSALAPGADVDFVISGDTNTTGGLELSELYIVDHNLADIMTESFGGCEANRTSANAQFLGSLAEQAASEGITYTVSTGDSGAEGCDSPSQTTANGPVSSSILSATPFNIAVGGTMFHEGTGTFWGASNGLNPNALSYIPETVWNETCTTACVQGQPPLSAGGGGVSQFFIKPSWQSGVPGIPNDGFRDQPDVSLTSANHDGYIVCDQSVCPSQFFVFSGTSAAAPSFAAIMALVDQKTGSRQGQANYVLYRLAAADIAASRKCNGSSTTLPASTCNFNDVTSGNNAVPGEAGYGTSSGKYQATTAYDLATGLGSVNANNIINNWTSATFTPSTTNLVSISPTTITHGAPVNVQVTVTPSSATGDVSLRNGDVPLSGSGFIDGFTLAGGTAAGTTNFLPGGTYHVIAHYAGDKTFAPSDSAAPGILVTVNHEPSTVGLAVSTFDTAGNIVAYLSQPYGTVAYVRADVAGASGNGIPSGPLNFLDNGSSLLNSTLNTEGAAATSQGYAAFSVGAHNIVAQYGGDVSFSPNNSVATPITVTKATATDTLTSSSMGVAEGASVTLTATFATNSLAQGPTGQVTFFAGNTAIATGGNPAALNSTPGSVNIQDNAATTATATTLLSTTLPVGANVITAHYAGDANFSASTSAPVTVNVAADFDFTPATAPVTATRGVPTTVMFTIAGHPGYASTINFTGASCTGLPRETTCSFNPASVTGNGSTTVTITTTAPKTASLHPLDLWMTGSGGVFAAICLLGVGSRRRRWGTWLTLFVFASLMTIVGCGGGGSSAPPPDPGTPVGTYTVTVKAADSLGVLSHNAVVTLTVQ